MREGRLHDRVAVVTGGASGIGRATVHALAAEGAHVALVDRDASGAERTAAEASRSGSRTKAFVVDLADAGAIEGTVDAVLAEFGRIDILVNAAAISSTEGIVDFSDDSFDRVMAITLKAPFLLMQHVGRHMVARGGGGRIVNVSSSSAFRARQSIATYGAAKAGLVQLSRSAAADLGPHDIHVNTVAPGLTATPMTADYGDAEKLDQETIEGPLANLLHRVSRPSDVAAAILFLCLPASRQITGQTIHTSAGAVTP